mmetsp:Transcript_4601/g.10838  ORF Transcript_4601/g.10838 Transcript_4601/m.10838 type:complete len:261 (-) Transcript_4601:1315-2097(-)
MEGDSNPKSQDVGQDAFGSRGLCLRSRGGLFSFLLDVDDFVPPRTVSDGEDIGPCEVLNDVDHLAHRLGQLRHRVLERRPVLAPCEDGGVAPALDDLDHGVAELEDLLSGQWLPGLDHGPALEGAAVGDHGLALGVAEDVGHADAVLVVVVATVESTDGAVGPLAGDELRLRHAVEEAHDPGPARGDAELEVGWVHAGRRRHGHPEVVRTRRVGVQPGLDQAVGLDAAEEGAANVPPVEFHRPEVVSARVGDGEVVLRHE